MVAVPTSSRRALALALALGVLGCRASAPDDQVPDGTDTAGEDDGPEPEPLPPQERATLTHSFGEYTLAPLEELQPCIQWTPSHQESLYVQAVTLANDGGFHHSNWFILPQSAFEGSDGFFECSSRGFTEFEAAFVGTVLTAQSTQSRYERMELPPGVVVKIPPGYKIVAGGHLLNLADAEQTTEMRMSLELIHPRDVEVVATPFRLSYYDLELPGFTESRFSATCNFANAYEDAANGPLDLRLFYALPHYHNLGNYFDLSIVGGPRDGQSVFRLDGFNADANGQTYADPVDLTGATGLRFTCGYDNWTDQTLGWGIGANEMCVMLGLADSAVMLDGSVVQDSSQVVGTDGEVLLTEGPCNVLGIKKNLAHTMPLPAEVEAPLHVPVPSPGDVDLPPVDPCVDTSPEIEPDGLPTLSRLRDTLLVSSCQFSSCHAGPGAAAGLDLTATDLHRELMDHQVQADTDLPLVAPGDPEGSWLYRLVTECEPTNRRGEPVAHMPLNSPQLSDPALVAILREWIAGGATDN